LIARQLALVRAYTLIWAVTLTIMMVDDAAMLAMLFA
jgi:hypothetical protein